MKVLVVGNGGREHVLAWKFAQSPKVDKVYAAPGSDGIKNVAECVAIDVLDFDGLSQFAKEAEIDLTMVGPEVPLVHGIVDHFKKEGLKIFGPTEAAAQIEGSKHFAKTLMTNYQIPTSEFQTFTDYDKAKDYIAEKGAPIVLKADGLAAGKGVIVAMTEEEAEAGLKEIMQDAAFGEAGSQVVIEDFLEGEEFSLMALVNGETVVPLAIAQDHKRAFEGDKGLNTGGMGAYSPVPQIPDSVVEEAIQTILIPTAKAMVKENCSFTGILYAGLMLTANGPKVIEFNCRFGDPETQVILPRLESDFVQAIEDVLAGQTPELTWTNQVALGTVLASSGYPKAYEKGNVIPHLAELNGEALVFHAGTKKVNDEWVTNGGRVLLVAKLADTLQEAQAQVNASMKKIESDATFYRKDIGHRALKALI
ncbi:phosphoribosylamine--glycine ligase [Terrilactibacillus sp. BCM23-1]|uniref:Phosphoribosylamine--glycine ligase n=1 Tax=Terrilactibacillus tamarindi TaxID=2599694 RepID=A0A6N8CUX6_9BACI|nr:phosphoribosylamine--glycine ligase [Terrilactibacillus tamarindi]MTT33033.1 phosphoribosylamine--glycine ligase [Terrilactibacillus tamarindi]